MLQTTIMLLTVLLSSVHALMHIEDFKHTTTVSHALSGVNVAVIGFSAYVKPGKVSGECTAAAQGFHHLVTQLRFHISQKYVSEHDVRNAVKEALCLFTSVSHSCSHSPPPWVLKRVEKVDEAIAVVATTGIVRSHGYIGLCLIFHIDSQNTASVRIERI